MAKEVSKEPAIGISKKEREENFSKIGYFLRKGNKKDKLYFVKKPKSRKK